MQLKVTQLLSLFIATGSAFSNGIAPKRINTLVTFGDSFTDIVNTGDGGVAWPVYASGYAGLTLHPFARSGGTCSNKITNRPFPSVFESQLPTFLAQKADRTISVHPDRTLYTLWIGTNDVGSNALLTTYGNLPQGASIVDVTECAVGWVERMYQEGARNLVVQNMIPLNLIPTYANGTYPDRFWNLERNSTAWSHTMFNLVNAGNALSKALLTNLAPKLKGAHIGIFDSYGLFLDMYHNPARYLNGTAPLNVTGSVNACVFSFGGATHSCDTVPEGSDRDSYLWYDELHPSEQANRVVAREIADVAMGRRSRWMTWLS